MTRSLKWFDVWCDYTMSNRKHSVLKKHRARFSAMDDSSVLRLLELELPLGAKVVEGSVRVRQRHSYDEQ